MSSSSDAMWATLTDASVAELLRGGEVVAWGTWLGSSDAASGEEILEFIVAISIFQNARRLKEY